MKFSVANVMTVSADVGFVKSYFFHVAETVGTAVGATTGATVGALEGRGVDAATAGAAGVVGGTGVGLLDRSADTPAGRAASVRPAEVVLEEAPPAQVVRTPRTLRMLRAERIIPVI